MRIRFILVLFLIQLLNCFQIVVGQDIAIRLNIINQTEKEIQQLTIKCNNKVIIRIMTDTNGFTLISKNILDQFLNYDLFLTSLGVQETYLTTINNKTPESLVLNLPQKYHMRFGKAVCPKCKKINHVYKLKPSEAPILVRKIVKGDTIFSPMHNGYYYISDVTNNLDPKWYCETNDIFY